MINVLFAVLGLLVAMAINALADTLPRRQRQAPPHCPQCGHRYGPLQWLGIGRLLWGNGRCPDCELPTRKRVIAVEISTAVLFAALTVFIKPLPDLIINSFYTAVFILIIVIDLEHKLILDVVTFPITAVALLFSFVVTDNSFWLALLGAIVGFVLFFPLFWLGTKLFGPGALGFGDVKLAMAMGAMLGFHRILFALALAILLGGVFTALLLLSRRVNRNSYLPYGQYLAIAGIVMLIWGVQIADWYARGGSL